MRPARMGRIPVAAAVVALLLGGATTAHSQSTPPDLGSPGYSQPPATGVPIGLAVADPPPAGSAKSQEMTKLYDTCLTCNRPLRYGKCGCARKHKGCFQKETIFEWAIGCDPRKKNGNGKGKDDDDDKDDKDDKDEPKEEDRLSSDRPDFTEASSTVGRGRVQLEGGYTYIGDSSRGVRTSTHSFPETLLRIGLFADWFELRIAENVFSQSTRGGRSVSPLPNTGFPPELTGQRRTTDTGSADLYLGAKLALTKQKGVMPETALILQGTVPTGARAFTAGRTLYGFNYLFGWDVTESITLGGSFQANKSVDDTGRSYVLFAQSLTAGYKLTKNLNAYTEWFAFYPAYANDTGSGGQHYLDGGFQYFVTKDFALDIRMGVGLSRSADDFFTGVGFVVRY